MNPPAGLILEHYFPFIGQVAVDVQPGRRSVQQQIDLGHAVPVAGYRFPDEVERLEVATATEVSHVGDGVRRIQTPCLVNEFIIL